MRLGKYTGLIYTDEESKDMKECGVVITENKHMIQNGSLNTTLKI